MPTVNTSLNLDEGELTLCVFFKVSDVEVELYARGWLLGSCFGKHSRGVSPQMLKPYHYICIFILTVF